MMLSSFAPWVLVAALLLDALVGDPDWLWRRLPHPVVGFGWLISRMERAWNDPAAPPGALRWRGVAAVVALVVASGGVGLALVSGLRTSLPVPAALAVEAVVAAIFLAQRSLHEHVMRVRAAFETGGLEAGRTAVSMIVGRDPQTLDEAGVARASIETTAENFSDGVTAPAFWYLVLGLPGLLVYKALNTADSMIGHRSARYADFGWCAARVDDAANLLPARLSGCLLVAAAGLSGRNWGAAWRIMWRDAGLHKSPNAGWPEAAMAGALGLALAGPRVYAGETVADPWLNADGDRTPGPDAIDAALDVFRWACGSLLICAVLIALLSA